MKLSSVQSLKAELFSGPVAVAANLAVATPLTAFAARRATAQRTMSGIALGVTMSKKNQFRLAVRLQRTGPLISAMTEEISKKAKGEVDVHYIGAIVKFQGPTTAAFYRRRRRPVRIGSSIGDVPPPGFIAAGTLGCFVVRRSPPHYISLLTNNHVIADENRNAIGSPIAQPGTLDGGHFPNDTIAALGKMVKLKATGINFVDAAIGDIYEGVDIDTRTIGNLGDLSGQEGDIDALPANATLHRVGRTTGQRKGRLRAFELDNVRVEYDMGGVAFRQPDRDRGRRQQGL